MAGGKTGRNTGVGRGNGSGSKATQFRDGMPSANPHGRPRKPKPAPSGSLVEAMAKRLRETVRTREDGVSRKRSRADAMALDLLSRFGGGSISEKLAIMRYIHQIRPGPDDSPPAELSATAIEDFVAELAAEARKIERSG